MPASKTDDSSSSFSKLFLANNNVHAAPPPYCAKKHLYSSSFVYYPFCSNSILKTYTLNIEYTID